MLCPKCVAPCEDTHQFCPRCGSSLAEAREEQGKDPLIGSDVGGNYRVRECIGEGGMGRVYAAEHASLGKTVAIKFIHPHLLSDESAVVRFYTEARATSRLNHPNSVGVLDFGKTQSGQLYIVMEYLRGRDLSMILADQPQIGFRRLAKIMRQVLSALADAHDLGIIHRDLKPDNILIEELRTGGDFVKVLDFGLAKIKGVADKSATIPGLICGTPEYMSPEQGRGDQLDPRSDLYSLGVIIYQCLCGRLPFEHESPTETVLLHLTTEPTPPNVIAPQRGIPDELVEITSKAMQKDPDRRYGSALDMAAALDAFLGGARAPSAICPSCHASNPSTVRYCGDCGARLPTRTGELGVMRQAPTPPVQRRTLGYTERPIETPPARRPSHHHVETIVDLGFCGRDADLEGLLMLRSESERDGTVVRLVGDSGIGKSRLLEALGHRALAKGDLVVHVGPDPSWATPSYHVALGIVRGLLGVPEGSSPEDVCAAARRARLPAAVDAGVREICLPSGAEGLEPHLRRRVAATALRELVARACASSTACVVVLVDDLHRCDAPSRAALAALAVPPIPGKFLLVAAHPPSFDPKMPPDSSEVVLGGLAKEDVLPLLAPGPGGGKPAELPFPLDPERGVSPLYLRQFLAFTAEGGGEAPVRLADLVATRVERLPGDARRLLQAAAILGEEMDLSVIPTVAGVDRDTEGPFRLLAERGFLVGDDRRRRFTHPLVAEVVAATIPAAARREMHARAVSLLAGRSYSFELVAYHSQRSGEAFGALLLLERAWDRATRRGDLEGALDASRRGLEIARRELSRGEMEEPERALLLFSSRLGETLRAAGDLRRAEAVLCEALDLGVGEAADRARVVASLGTVLGDQGRLEPATLQHQEAVRLAKRSRRPQLEAEMHHRFATHLHAAGRLKEAVSELSLGVEALAGQSQKNDAELKARLLLLQSETLLALGDAEGARFPLADALDVTDDLGSRALSAQALRLQARVLEAKGELASAQSRFSRALQIFEELGDVEAVEAMMQAIERVSQPPPAPEDRGA